MTCHMLTRTLLTAGMLLTAVPGEADTINLQQAVEMSLAADPRIKEREQVVEAARSMVQEVQGNAGWRLSANAFVGLADLSAGLESADKVADAIKSYVLVQTEYLRTVNDYNMNVAKLARLTGELK